MKAFYSYFRLMRWKGYFAFLLLFFLVILFEDGKNLSFFGKKTQETVSMILLGSFFAISVCFSLLYKTPFCFWLTWMAFALLSREIHYVGTGVGVYIALLMGFRYAFTRSSKLEPHFKTPYVITLLGLGLSAYVFSQLLDQRFFRGFPYEDIYEVPLEESFETLGHLCFFLLPFVFFKTTNRGTRD